MKNNLIKIYSISMVAFLFLISLIAPMAFGYNEESSCSNNEENKIYEKFPSSSGPMDSPWPMKCHDLHHTGRSPHSTADNLGIEKWRFKCNWVEGGIVIGDDGTLYFGDNHAYFFALNPDGSLKWKYEGGKITSAPAIGEDGTIYVGSWDRKLYAFYPDGTLKWKENSGNGVIASSPAIANDGTIYVGTMRDFDKGDVVAFYPNGTKRWIYETGYLITSDPAIGDDGTIYIGSGDTCLYALYPNGTLRWRFKTNDIVKASPSIADDGTIYIGSFDGYLYALYPNGSMKWKCKVGAGTETNPSIASDGTIYVGGQKLYAIYPDGTLKWSFDLGPERYILKSSPAISVDGTIYTGVKISDGDGGEIIAVNPDGTEKWRKKIAKFRVESSPCIGEDGTVYIGSSFDDGKGYLHAFGKVDSNVPPETPTITGTTNGTAGEEYLYYFASIDPDNNPVSYYIDWGDGTIDEWRIEGASGERVWAERAYTSQGTYTIKAKAKDTLNEESDWATLSVSMPKNKAINTPFLNFLDNHPQIFPILRQLLGL